jgi:hypothetical protein
MWDPQRLTTLWASTACYRDSFTLLVLCYTSIFCDITRCSSLKVNRHFGCLLHVGFLLVLPFDLEDRGEMFLLHFQHILRHCIPEDRTLKKLNPYAVILFSWLRSHGINTIHSNKISFRKTLFSDTVQNWDVSTVDVSAEINFVVHILFVGLHCPFPFGWRSCGHFSHVPTLFTKVRSSFFFPDK